MRARLDRLERAARDARDSAPVFVIDMALARSLRDDYNRASELASVEDFPGRQADRERLSARVAERASTITVPEGYDDEQAKKDSARLNDLWDRGRGIIGRRHKPLSDAEKDEEAQLRARQLAYNRKRQPETRERQLET